MSLLVQGTVQLLLIKNANSPTCQLDDRIVNPMSLLCFTVSALVTPVVSHDELMLRFLLSLHFQDGEPSAPTSVGTFEIRGMNLVRIFKALI